MRFAAGEGSVIIKKSGDEPGTSARSRPRVLIPFSCRAIRSRNLCHRAQRTDWVQLYMDRQRRLFLGVDIGGTKIAAGLVTTCGEIVCRTRTPMISSRDAAAGFEGVKTAIRRILDQVTGVEIAAMGVSCPGPLDPMAGVVLNPPNIPCWRDFSLRAQLEAEFSLPVCLDNDANSVALAEARWGAGVGYPSVFSVTIGTGIGTGIVLDGQILHGRTGAAGEGGHVSIDCHGPRCSCGKLGCIEAMASGTAIARRAIAKLKEQTGTGRLLLAIAGGDLNSISTEMVAEAWHAGDPVATCVLHETAELLAMWLGNIIDVLEPHVIVVGGGAGELMSQFFGEIQTLLPKWSINKRCTEIPLRVAHYGSDSGIAGAAALCLEADGTLERNQIVEARQRLARLEFVPHQAGADHSCSSTNPSDSADRVE